MKSLPVFIHHEVLETMKSESDYYIFSLKSASDNSSNVVLFGNSKNEKMWNNWVDTDRFLKQRWIDFKRYHTNLAVGYNDEWALAFYKRLFSFYEYAKEYGISEFFMMDSDVLMFEKVISDDFSELDNAACTKKNQDIFNNDNMRQAVSVEYSYWKTECLSKFLDFIIDMYCNHLDILKKKYEYHKEQSCNGGVCEMTLMWHFWNKVELKKKNLFIRDSNHVHCAVMRHDENYLAAEYEMDSITGMKKIVFKNGIPYLIDTKGNKVQAGALHFQGVAKVWMRNFYEYSVLQKNNEDAISNIKNELLAEADRVVVYGAGDIAKKINMWFLNNQKNIFCHIVSKLTNQVEKIYNAPVIELSGLKNDGKEKIFLLGSVFAGVKKQMEDNLKEYGFETIRDINLLVFLNDD